MSLVVVTANIPNRSANAGTGSIPKVNGSRIANPTSPESPGTAPKNSPASIPANRYPTAGQAITDRNPLSAASTNMLSFD